MELSKLAPKKGSRKKKIRLGRGESSGHGKTCGKGNKGQSARTGYSNPAGFEGGQMPLYRRLPKKGFTSRARVLGSNRYNLVDLSTLDKFSNGAIVDSESLKSLISSRRGGGVKVLGTGKLTKKLTVKVNAVSGSAKTAIEKLGGQVELV